MRFTCLESLCWALSILTSLSLTLTPDRARSALTDSLVAFYQFENNLLDTSGALPANHGAGVNGPQFTGGKIGSALWLPGIADYMTLDPSVLTALDFGSTSAGDAADFSVSMWVRQDDTSSDPAVFSNKNWAHGGNTGINWAVKGNGIFDLNTKGDSGLRRDLDTAANSSQLGIGAWNLVVMTVDRDGPTTLYINGTATGTIPLSSQGDFQSGLPWNVGQDGTGSYGVEFTGAVDELAIWRRALGPTETDALWNGGAGVVLGDQVFDSRLRLVIDRDTGAITIQNNTGAAQPLVGYQITSAAGTFRRSGWNPVTGRLDAAGDHSLDADDRWVVLTSPTSSSDLSEGSLGEGVLASGAQIELGSSAWEKFYADVTDIAFTYVDGTSASPLEGFVEFSGNGGASYDALDLNFDGALDLSDYAVFLANYDANLLGLSAAARHNRGDLDGDGRHSVRDFQLFKEEFDARRGSGALASLIGASGVPEPSAGVLGLGGVVFFLRRRDCLTSRLSDVGVV